MVDGIEEFGNIRTPHKRTWKCLEETLDAINGTMKSFAFPAGPDIKEKNRIEFFHEIVVEKPMNDSISNTRNRDHAFFRILNLECFIRTVPIRQPPPPLLPQDCGDSSRGDTG